MKAYKIEKMKAKYLINIIFTLLMAITICCTNNKNIVQNYLSCELQKYSFYFSSNTGLNLRDSLLKEFETDSSPTFSLILYNPSISEKYTKILSIKKIEGVISVKKNGINDELSKINNEYLNILINKAENLESGSFLRRCDENRTHNKNYYLGLKFKGNLYFQLITDSNMKEEQNFGNDNNLKILKQIFIYANEKFDNW